MEGAESGEKSVCSQMCFQGCTVGVLLPFFQVEDLTRLRVGMTSILEFALSQVPGSADASVRGPHFENHRTTDSFSFRASVYSTGLGWCCSSFMKGTNSDPGKTPLELSQSCRQHRLYVPGSWRGLCPPRTGLQSLIPLIFKDFFSVLLYSDTLKVCCICVWRRDRGVVTSPSGEVPVLSLFFWDKWMSCVY